MGGALAGLAAMYADAAAPRAFVTNVSVVAERRGAGVASGLVRGLIDDARARGVFSMALEVARENRAAVALYRHLGFRLKPGNETIVEMELDINGGDDER